MDIIAQRSFGSDVILLDSALAYVFIYYFVNARRIAIGGFSDGASYALSMSLGNGDLFTHIVAFSPCFYHTPVARGKLPVFISHGTQDRVLPINPCSRRIVPELKANGLAITYKEFEGAHEIPLFNAQIAIEWFFR